MVDESCWRKFHLLFVDAAKSVRSQAKIQRPTNPTRSRLIQTRTLLISGCLEFWRVAMHAIHRYAPWFSKRELSRVGAIRLTYQKLRRYLNQPSELHDCWNSACTGRMHQAAGNLGHRADCLLETSLRNVCIRVCLSSVSTNVMYIPDILQS